MKIFVTGLTSSRLGGMEFHNLGNFIIADTMFLLLRQNFPNSTISTSIQMTDDFYKKYDLEALKEKRYWSYGPVTGLKTFLDFGRLFLWKIFGGKTLLKGSSLLSEINKSDLIIDFSGDIYGDNAVWRKFLEGNARLFFALMLKKPVAMIIGSPGPFSSMWRLAIAKRMMPKLSILTNREPLSTEMLAYVGIKGDKIRTTACPSVLFKKDNIENLKFKKDYNRIFESHIPTIGIIICGWNMPVGPYNRWPRDDWEYETFIELINHLLEKTDCRICLMSHQNATDNQGNLVKGNDHSIIEQLLKLIGKKYDRERLFTLNDVYDAAQSKTIISSFELVISGRIHGAVQALSQGIPTLILDYGHDPKAHKLKGFARHYGVDDYVCNPSDTQEMLKTVENLLLNKDQIAPYLNKRLPFIKERAEKGFSILKEIVPEINKGAN